MIPLFALPLMHTRALSKQTGLAIKMILHAVDEGQAF